MNSKTLTLCALGLIAFAPITIFGQNSEVSSAEDQAGLFLLSPADLEELLGPMALHPDALVALILPAATAPEDIVLAARFLERGEDNELIDEQSWDESVKALARYPDLVTWLNENLEWTIEVGEAFMAQPADVMQAIQRLRSLALEAGTLTDSPQQSVVVENEVVRIVPANPTVIYVPYYDPAVVYVRRTHYSYAPRSFFSFSIGFGVGSWLTYDCDWIGHRIWYVENRRYWNTYRDWRNPRFPGYYGYVAYPHRHPWSPPPRRYRRVEGDRERIRNNWVDSRPNRLSPRSSVTDRRVTGRYNRNGNRTSNPSNDRRNESPTRTRRGSSPPDRDNVVTTPPTRERRSSTPRPAPRVVSPRERIVNVLRQQPTRPSTTTVQPRSTHTRPEGRTQRVASASRVDPPSPRVVSPRERVVNVLRSRSEPARVRTASAPSSRPSQSRAASRTERQAPVVIHGRTITRNDSRSSGQSTDSDQNNQGRRGRGR